MFSKSWIGFPITERAADFENFSSAAGSVFPLPKGQNFSSAAGSVFPLPKGQNFSTESFHLPCSCRSQQSSQLLKSRHRTTSRRIFAALFYLDFEALFYCFILFPRFSSFPWTLPSVQASVTSSVPFCCSILAQVVEARSHRAAPVISFPAETTYDGERLENLSTQQLKVTVRRATE